MPQWLAAHRRSRPTSSLVTHLRRQSRRAVGVAMITATVALAPALVPPLASTPPGVTAEAATVRPYRLGGTWRLVFADHFSGSRLDTGKWRPNWLGPSDRSVTKPVNTLEKSCYDPRNVSVSRGTLRLTAQKRRCKANTGKTYAYASGLVESRHDFRFSYGYAEARIYLPPSSGKKAPKGSCGPNWAAFWLNGDRWPNDGEIDVMECLSGNDVAWHHHGGTRARIKTVGGYPKGWRNNMPGTGGWHTFGADWTKGRVTFYYDGRRVGSTTSKVTGKPHYLILNLGVSGSKIAVPQTMQVDYVRVWKRA